MEQRVCDVCGRVIPANDPDGERSRRTSRIEMVIIAKDDKFRKLDLCSILCAIRLLEREETNEEA